MPSMNRLALLFDIDGTLTPPRQPLRPAMAAALGRLNVPFHVAAGSDLPLVKPQFLDPLAESGFRGEFEAFLSNGAAHYRCRYAAELAIVKQSEFEMRRHLGNESFERMLREVEEVLDSADYRLPPPLQVIGSRLVDRRGMLNVTPIGRPADTISPAAQINREHFARFDRETGYRRRMLATFHERLGWLAQSGRLRMMLGGETSFDFVIEDMDKTNAVRGLLAMGLDRVVFLGDALFPGGNDSVIGDLVDRWQAQGDRRLEAVPVDGWEDTLRILGERGWLG
jgi:phosphomannomutase